MARTSRLKVFQARLGFYDTVVAVPNQPAALRAWGVHQNLFADGQAGLANDKAAIEAAVARPGTVLKRPVGAEGKFEVDPATLPEPLSPRRRLKKSATRARE
ncbi:MAG TPA: hypothetical protein VGH15_01765 [Caulobacteraceae bacterium]